jgi:hypothetical protein
VLRISFAAITLVLLLISGCDEIKTAPEKRVSYSLSGILRTKKEGEKGQLQLITERGEVLTSINSDRSRLQNFTFQGFFPEEPLFLRYILEHEQFRVALGKYSRKDESIDLGAIDLERFNVATFLLERTTVMKEVKDLNMKDFHSLLGMISSWYLKTRELPENFSSKRGRFSLSPTGELIILPHEVGPPRFPILFEKKLRAALIKNSYNVKPFSDLEVPAQMEKMHFYSEGVELDETGVLESRSTIEVAIVLQKELSPRLENPVLEQVRLKWRPSSAEIAGKADGETVVESLDPALLFDEEQPEVTLASLNGRLKGNTLLFSLEAPPVVFPELSLDSAVLESLKIQYEIYGLVRNQGELIVSIQAGFGITWH